jgi:alkylation response protein AidB-like acyl-CoA dehydrogenase
MAVNLSRKSFCGRAVVRGLFKEYPLERHYRDIRAGLVMNPSTDSLLLQIGRAELNLNTL